MEADFLPSGQGTSVLFRDVTDRKAAELAGEKVRDLLNSALDATSSEIGILDEEGRVLVANRAWHRFMTDTGEYLPDSGIGEHYLDIRCLHPVKPQLLAFRSGVRSVLTGETREFGLNFRTKVRGGYRSYRLRASHRHAHASAVHVGVAVSARRISLGVADDGVGIARDVEGKLVKSGVGISGMRASAHQFGGCLKIRSSGKGTVVFVRIPLSPATAVLPAA